jgi:hypothetical protein
MTSLECITENRKEILKRVGSFTVSQCPLHFFLSPKSTYHHVERDFVHVGEKD